MSVLTSLQRAGKLLKTAGEELIADEGLRKAAALTYYSAFSIVPLLFVAVAVAGFLLDDPRAVDRVVGRVTDFAGSDVGEIIETLLERVRSQRGGTLSIGLVLAAFSASSVFQQVQSVLSTVFDVPEEQRRSGVLGWLVKRAVGVVAPIVLAVAALTPIVAVGAATWLIGLVPESLGWLAAGMQFGIPMVSMLMLMLMVGVSFQALTVVGVPWRAALRGGATTALIGLTASWLVGMYLSQVGSTGTLGALGGVAILLLFFDVMWVVYLFGAEVTKVYGDSLRYGDIAAPQDRLPDDLTRSGDDPDGDQAGRSGVLPFLVGILVGWATSRRR